MSFRDAKMKRNDEFYTQLVDIEKEMRFYREHFKNKIIYCNADDPFESNFIKYFALNFNKLGLKKLVATSYSDSIVAGEQLSLFDVTTFDEKPKDNKQPYKIEITEVKDFNEDGAVDWADISYILKHGKNNLQLLKGNGDFRSEESIELLKEADIVITNPPFSLFRDYVDQLMEYKKSFLIIGNQNAITYRQIFPLIKSNKIWLGESMNGSNRYFRVPNHYPLTEKTGKIEDGKKYAFVKGVVWFTNLDNNKRNEELILYRKYDPEIYPTYDNFDGINVDRVTDIPRDYEGVMGVPITFLHKYNPKQFEIIELSRYMKTEGMSEKFVRDYYASGQKAQITEGHPDLCFYDSQGLPKIPYMRILIKNKKVER